MNVKLGKTMSSLQPNETDNQENRMIKFEVKHIYSDLIHFGGRYFFKIDKHYPNE